MTGWEMTGFNLARSAAQVAGQSAVILDNAPGQDINRRVLIVHNDPLYDLTLTPMSNDAIEAFYAAILDHFVLVDPES